LQLIEHLYGDNNNVISILISIMKLYLDFSELHLKWMRIAVVCLGFSTMACSQRSSHIAGLKPVERISTQLVTLSRGLRSLDGLNVEGASLIAGQTKRSKERGDLAHLSAEYSTNYRNVVYEAVKLAQADVEAGLRTGFTPEEFEVFLPLIRQHLRLAKADALPSVAAISQDFQLLRYQKPFQH